MYLLKRQKASGAFNVKPNKHGGFKRMMRDKVEGYGVGSDIYKDMDTGNHKMHEHLQHHTNHLRVKASKPRKYISLNL